MKSKTFIVLLFFSLIFICILATFLGSVGVGFQDTISIIVGKILNKPINNIDDKYVAIIWKIRFPRVILSAIVGAGLAAGGTAIQSVLKNPLASPYTLGVSSGASFGVALSIFFKVTIPILGAFTLPFIGFVFAFATIFFVLLLTNRFDKNFANNTIVLIGMITSLFINAILTLLIYFSGDDAKQIIYWQMGSLSSKNWNHVVIILPFFIIGVIGLFFLNRELDALSFGENSAKSLGVDVKKVKLYLILFASIITGSLVSITGTIGFIDMVSPHIARKLVGSRHVYVLPTAMIIGAIFLVMADLVSRTIVSPSELPVGSITALIGAPFFAYIYLIRKKK